MKRFILPILFTLTFLGHTQAQRVVGFYPNWKSVGDLSNIQWGKITDIVYAFAVPNGTGGAVSIQNTTLFNALVSDAQSNAVRVYLSIGGAGQSGNFGSIAASPSARTTLATNLANIVQTNNLDGIDLDWEFPGSWEASNFTSLCQALKNALDAKEGPMGKQLELSIDVSPVQFNNGGVTSSSYAYVDYVNIMAYDDDRGIHGSNHSAYALGPESILYWNSNKGLSKSKMRLGVPFYGRFGLGGAGESYNILSAGNPSAAYNADLFGGYYYNGRTTLENKSTLVLNEGLNGIMIWELSQDRNDQYSLLNAIDGILDAGTPCENPNLGISASLCQAPSVLLDPQVSGTAPDFSYAWTKDAVPLPDVTPTLTATVAGTYCVTYSHTGGCPTKNDCIDVVDAANVNVQDGEICEAGTVDLSVLDGGTFKWYDQATNGTLLHTGTNYTTPSISSTTTYYVEKPDVSDTVGKPYPAWMPDFGQGWTPAASNTPTDDWYMRLIFDAYSDFTIDFVTVYTGSAQTLTITVYNSGGGTVGSNTVAVGAGKVRVPLGVSLTTGTDYEIGINDGATIWLEDDGMMTDRGYPFTTAGILSVKSTDTKWGPVNNWYMGIYDWEVSSAGSCGRVPVTATINTDCTPPNISINTPTDGYSQNGLASIALSADATDSDGSISGVTFNIYDGSNPTPIAIIAGSQAGSTFTGNWVPADSGSYVVEAVATDDDNNTAADQHNITITLNATGTIAAIDGSVNIHPNPTQGLFHVVAASAIQSIVVVDLQGRIVAEGEADGTSGTFGESLGRGLYQAIISTADGVSTQRVVKQ